MSTLARMTVPGGEVVLIASGGTERILRVQRGANLFLQVWDPRETGTALLVDHRHWEGRPDETIDDADWEWLQDALFRMAPETKGVRQLLEYDPKTRCYVARHWDRGTDGFLVSLRDGQLDYLERGRTLRLMGSTDYGQVPAVLTLDASSARWLVPHKAPVVAQELDDICARLPTTTEDNLVLSAQLWSIRCEPPTHAKSHKASGRF